METCEIDGKKPCGAFTRENDMCNCFKDYQSETERQMPDKPEPEHNLSRAEKMLLPISLTLAGLLIVWVLKIYKVL